MKRGFARSIARVAAFPLRISAASRIASDMNRGLTPRQSDMDLLGISDAYRNYRRS